MRKPLATFCDLAETADAGFDIVSEHYASGKVRRCWTAVAFFAAVLDFADARNVNRHCWFICEHEPAAAPAMFLICDTLPAFHA